MKKPLWKCIAAAVCFALGGANAWAAAALEFFPVSDTVRVFEDGYACPAPLGAAIRVFGLREETVSAQCVVRANEALAGLTVSVSPLTSKTAKAIPAEAVTWNFVSGINILTNTPSVKPADLTRPAPARFPDCLADERRSDAPKGTLKAVYLTVKIPAGAEPGEYAGTVSVSAGAAAASLPLQLKVYPLTMPNERHVRDTIWFTTRGFQKFHGIAPGDEEGYWRMLRTYAENMADHRQDVFEAHLSLICVTLGKDGKLVCDFTAFDRFAQVFWDTERMSALETGFVAEHGKGGWASEDIHLASETLRDAATGKSVHMDGETYLAQFLPLFVEHLRQKGWLAKTLFHLSDEPANDNVLAWRKISEYVHKCAPELRRIDAIETPHCQGDLEVWVPKLDHLATWQSMYEEAQRKGAELWFYTVGIFQGGSFMNKTVDRPLIDTRLMHWLNYRYGLSGYLHWGLNEWTDDPWNAPGEHRGDGWHLYPKKNGILNSLRWEQMRNGLQDYECLWLLEDKTRKLQATLPKEAAAFVNPRRRGVEIASGVVATYSEYSRDPAVLYAARRQAIEEAADFDLSPRIVLRTEPMEHSFVFSNCGIDVCGWAEPGTKLTVNNRKITVGADGRFFAMVQVSRANTLTVEAVNEKGKKSFTRTFRSQTTENKGGK